MLCAADAATGPAFIDVHAAAISSGSLACVMAGYIPKVPVAKGCMYVCAANYHKYKKRREGIPVVVHKCMQTYTNYVYTFAQLLLVMRMLSPQMASLQFLTSNHPRGANPPLSQHL